MPRDHFDGTKLYNPRSGAGAPSSVPRCCRRVAPLARSVPVTQRLPPPERRRGRDLHRPRDLSDPDADGDLLTDPVFSDTPVRSRVWAPALRRAGIALTTAARVDDPSESQPLRPLRRRALRALARRFDPAVITPLGTPGCSAPPACAASTSWIGGTRRRRRAAGDADAGPAFFRANAVRSESRVVGRFSHRRGARRIYFAGDSGYTTVFTEVTSDWGRRSGDVAIGAYEPRWFMRSIHMNPAEAVQAHIDLRANTSVAMHFGTFQLTPEGIDEPVRALAEARDGHGIAADAFRTLDVGESIVLG